MSSSDYELLIRFFLGGLLLLAPAAGIIRAVRRYKAKQISTVAPAIAGVTVAADAVAGLAGLFDHRVAFGCVLFASLWLGAALGANAVARRAQAEVAPELPPEPPAAA